MRCYNLEMLGPSYPFVVVAAFVIVVALIAYYSGGGMRFFVAIMVCFVSIAAMFIVPHLIAPFFERLPANAKYAAFAGLVGWLVVAMVRGLYRKHVLGESNEDSESGPRE